VIPGVPEALVALRGAGIKLAVVSNSDGSIEGGLAARGLRDHFDEIFDSHFIGYEKPDARIFHHALEACCADPAKTLHVGDLYSADVVGARAAGVHPILLDPFDDWGDVDCALVPDLTVLSERVLRGR
jgi:putative hydrolase of the HAD superfamily